MYEFYLNSNWKVVWVFIMMCFKLIFVRGYYLNFVLVMVIIIGLVMRWWRVRWFGSIVNVGFV